MKESEDYSQDDRSYKLSCQEVLSADCPECINCYFEGRECKVENCPMYHFTNIEKL